MRTSPGGHGARWGPHFSRSWRFFAPAGRRRNGPKSARAEGVALENQQVTRGPFVRVGLRHCLLVGGCRTMKSLIGHRHRGNRQSKRSLRAPSRIASLARRPLQLRSGPPSCAGAADCQRPAAAGGLSAPLAAKPTLTTTSLRHTGRRLVGAYELGRVWAAPSLTRPRSPVFNFGRK